MPGQSGECRDADIHLSYSGYPSWGSACHILNAATTTVKLVGVAASSAVLSYRRQNKWCAGLADRTNDREPLVAAKSVRRSRSGDVAWLVASKHFS